MLLPKNVVKKLLKWGFYNSCLHTWDTCCFSCIWSSYFKAKVTLCRVYNYCNIWFWIVLLQDSSSELCQIGSRYPLTSCREEAVIYLWNQWLLGTNQNSRVSLHIMLHILVISSMAITINVDLILAECP